MSEDIIFDCLHAEIVNYCLEDKVTKGNDDFFQSIHIKTCFQENDLSTLEYIGFTTGFRLIERLTRDVCRFNEELDAIKYICTDFWTIIYKKQVDNLRTNNHGMYVVQDKAFRFLTRISPGSKLLEHAPKVSDIYVYSTIRLIPVVNF